MQSRNAETFRRQALQGIPKIQRQVFWNYDGCRDAWCNSRRWEFYKYEKPFHDNSFVGRTLCVYTSKT